MRSHAFPKGMGPKVNIIAQLEFELMLYSRDTNTSGNIIKRNLRTSMNKRIHFFIKNIISHTLFSKG